VTVARPVEREVVEWDEYTARLEAVDAVDVRARVSGYLEAVKFTDGAMVLDGGVGARIDNLVDGGSGNQGTLLTTIVSLDPVQRHLRRGIIVACLIALALALPAGVSGGAWANPVPNVSG